MKKIVSILLTVVLALGMTTMAFAAVGPEGKAYSLGNSARINNATKGTLLSDVETLNPKDVIYIPVLDDNGPVTQKSILSKDKITPSLKVRKGSTLLEKAEFEVVNGAVYMKVEVKSPFVSTKAADLEFTAALAYSNKADQNDVVSFYGKVENINNNDKIDTDDGVYDVVDASVFEVDKNFTGRVSFDFGNSIVFNKVRVFSNQKFYLHLNQDGNAEISKKYGDQADLSFYNFDGSLDNFSSVGTLSIPAEKNSYVYKIVDNTLVPVSYEYNTDQDAVEIQTKTLDNYVISDVKLNIDLPAEEAPSDTDAPSQDSGTSNDNPSTGASSMLNIAVVAGVLALAVAGGVSLKK